METDSNCRVAEHDLDGRICVAHKEQRRDVIERVRAIFEGPPPKTWRWRFDPFGSAATLPRVAL